MQVISYTDARKNLKSLFDRVVDDADAAIVTRRNGEDVVVMAKSDFDGLMETLHLLGSQANRTHLTQSIEEYRQGAAQPRNLAE
ncbi:type II toxin-antitoxin system Phd/YefM family antitoxin [Magnetofaba australis]|uniref:Antitoxin n=1 Tax=Magnetofaba australis IT-1 TaxID=1434232 RepID=A0A1Y2K197_9PROT|nr:type II toxin-antitoxin system prevent-host-death family antitoxin [Magnetofaba australis]OSM00071.1 putative prevent-host-death protein [Magnetofaba australis IT-1]